ncbi:hypothetical protein GCM10027596_21340 [Nocardioides korecus]
MTVKVTPEEIENVARTVVGPAYDKVKTALAAFRDTGDGAGAFGGSAPGEHLAELHSSVKTVFVETVHGVGEDLDTFKHNLTSTARSWHDTEQSNAERSQTLASHLGTTAATATHQAYRGTRDHLGQRLAVDPSLERPEGGQPQSDDAQAAAGQHQVDHAAGGEAAGGSGAVGG